MTDPRLIPLARRAIRTWGPAKQWAQVQEECAELIAAVSHHNRGRIGIDALADEIADVLIVAAQAAEMVPQDVLDDALARKLAKLEMRLAEPEVDR